MGKRCNTELSFERNLSFGKTKIVPYKTYPFLAPSEWIKSFFFKQEFITLITTSLNLQQLSIGTSGIGEFFRSF